MNRTNLIRSVAFLAVLTFFPALALSQDRDDIPAAQTIPNTGQQITPLAPRGARFQFLNPGLGDFPNYVAGQAVTTAVSPDKRTMLVLTSGYNLLNSTSTGDQKGLMGDKPYPETSTGVDLRKNRAELLKRYRSLEPTGLGTK